LKARSKKHLGRLAVCAALAFGISLGSTGLPPAWAAASDEDSVLLQIVPVAFGVDSNKIVRWLVSNGADRHYIYIDGELRAQLDISRTEFDLSNMFVANGASIQVFARVPGVATSTGTRERK